MSPSTQEKVWEGALKACIAVMPFVIGFLVWVTAQINVLKTEAALAKQARENLMASQIAVDNDIAEIKRTQLQILLVLEQIKSVLQKK